MNDLTQEKLADYRATAQKRTQQKEQQRLQHLAHAQSVAQQAANDLKKRYSVRQVAVFGSLVDQKLFHVRSDIDLAVWGLDERDYYRAIGELQALDPTFAIDLIRVEDAPASLVATIEMTGYVL
jgi:predicted nucleotidyltransferase